MFETFHVGGDEVFLFLGEVEHRHQLEQLFHVDVAMPDVVGVEVHELEVGEGHAAAVEHVVLQCCVVVVSGGEPKGAFYLDGAPLVAVAHQQIDHHEGVVVLEHRFIHHVDGGVVEVLEGLHHLFRELCRRARCHVDAAREVLVCEDTYVGAAFEFGALFDAEFIAQVWVFLGEIQGFFALQAFDIG